MSGQESLDSLKTLDIKRFVVLDRDGTIIVEKNYLSEPDQVELLPGVAKGLRKLMAMGLGLLVITNQSGIGRGYFTESRLGQINRRMVDILYEYGVILNGIYHCPHTPQDECNCRKPRLGLLETAAKDKGFDPSTCFVVGDKGSDIELGNRAGATTILVTTGYGLETAKDTTVRPDFTVSGLDETSETILGILNPLPRN
jgi:D-glycero-D-manno-heptose 1,7-bisphosphate phosphatase